MFMGVNVDISDCRIINIPKIQDNRGNLSVIESSIHLPFDIKRVYYLYDVPAGAERAGHAHRGLQQFVVAMSGSFDVVVDDGRGRTRFHLNRPFSGLLLCPMVWREIDNFSSGAVCVVFASNYYDEGDYIRDYAVFLAEATGR